MLCVLALAGDDGWLIGAQMDGVSFWELFNRWVHPDDDHYNQDRDEDDDAEDGDGDDNHDADNDDDDDTSFEKQWTGERTLDDDDYHQDHDLMMMIIIKIMI